MGVYLLSHKRSNMRKYLNAALLLALALTAENIFGQSALPTCIEADHPTSYDRCIEIQGTCSIAVDACITTLSGDAQAACIEPFINTFNNQLAAFSYSDCECDISCPASEEITPNCTAIDHPTSYAECASFE